MKINEYEKQEIIDRILSSSKYRGKGLNPATIQDLIDQEAEKHRSRKTIRKAVRRKLHNIVAPYLGDPDYEAFLLRLSRITDSSPNSRQLLSFCQDVLNVHASTAERSRNLKNFYHQLFEITGKPNSILDLACGMHPLSFPWMDLELSIQYHAFDIIQTRIDFINSFFKKLGLEPLARNQDILINPPGFHADLGFFFKEAHRFEKRNPGCNKEFFSSLDVDYLAISLPARDLAGKHSLVDHHRDLIIRNLPTNKGISELLIDDEIIFIVKAPGC